LISKKRKSGSTPIDVCGPSLTNTWPGRGSCNEQNQKKRRQLKTSYLGRSDPYKKVFGIFKSKKKQKKKKAAFDLRKRGCQHRQRQGCAWGKLLKETPWQKCTTTRVKGAKTSSGFEKKWAPPMESKKKRILPSAAKGGQQNCPEKKEGKNNDRKKNPLLYTRGGRGASMGGV